MTNSQIFTLAHKLTKANKKENDNYSVIFGAYVKMIKSGEIKMNEEKQEKKEIKKASYHYEINNETFFSLLIFIMFLITILMGFNGLAQNGAELGYSFILSIFPASFFTVLILKVDEMITRLLN